MKKVIVGKPIVVPAGRFCWDCAAGDICDAFDNEGGRPSCDEHLDCRKTLRYDKEGRVPKPPECLKLKEI